MDFRTIVRAGKCSANGTDRRDAPPSVHQIHRFPVPARLTSFNYKHDNREISQEKIAIYGMGTRRMRLANLPPETPDEAVSFASQDGEIKEMQREVWSKAYCYKVLATSDEAYSVPYNDCGT